MRPLPRVHAITDTAVFADPTVWIRAAAIAAAGPAVTLHARDHEASCRDLAARTERLLAHARPPGATVIVNGRPDVARALGAHGVQLRRGDLPARDARRIVGEAWIGCSVHSPEEAAHAQSEGADFLLVGPVFPTTSHPNVPPAGIRLVTETVRLGLPVIAIGGVTATRIPELRQAGAYGVAAISALWREPDSARATERFLEAWSDEP